MTLYSKHTNGEAFTLNDQDYVGFFHIIDGVAYTEQFQTEDSVQLTPKKSFISDIFLKRYETNTTYKSISGVIPYYSNVFDILNKQGLETALSNIDRNNLLCFKDLILGYPTIYRYEENNGFFYGLSAANIDSPSGKNGVLDIIPFTSDNTWSFMDSIICGTFVIDSNENFKYLCSTGTKNFILSGSFTKNSVLSKISEIDQHPDGTYTPEYTHHIHNDSNNNRIIYVNNDYINIYDSSNYEDCNNLILVDKILLIPTSTQEYIWNRTHLKWKDVSVKWTTKFVTTNTNNPQFIKFGKNIRTSIIKNILYILNKYSSDIYQTINLSDWNVSELLTLDIRYNDDNLILLHRKDSKLFILVIDPNDTPNSFSKELKSIDSTYDNYQLKFCNIDSNIFYISNIKEFHSRYISNPEYPSGRLDTLDLQYHGKWKWNEIQQKWKSFLWRWVQDRPSNYYNNIISSELIKNNNMYLLLHNVGRLYVMKQPSNDRFLHAIPLDLNKFYTGINCSESGLGIYFNTAISNLIKDTLNLFNQSSGSFSIYEKSVINRQLEDFILETDNLYINGNETINILTLQRIFLLITDIQSKLLPNTIEI